MPVVVLKWVVAVATAPVMLLLLAGFLGSEFGVGGYGGW